MIYQSDKLHITMRYTQYGIKNMNAKEKAKELMHVYTKKLLSVKYSINGFVINDLAKQCALIAVDEALDALIMESNIYGSDMIKVLNYYEDVKSELQSLQ